MHFIISCLKGIAIGAGAILPGISSGVFCVIFGIYEKLLNSILYFFKDIKNNFKFLLPIVVGVFIGVLIFSNFLNYFFINFPIQTKSIFIGLILGCIPPLIKQCNSKTPFKITNLKDGINIGAYGIREPKKDPYNELNVEDIDILIVPAVAYDKDCYRLGYGGGFYDRFIEHLRDDAITIGIAFDLQVFDSIPKENHDAQLNYVITENNMYIGKI